MLSARMRLQANAVIGKLNVAQVRFLAVSAKAARTPSDIKLAEAQLTRRLRSDVRAIFLGSISTNALDETRKLLKFVQSPFGSSSTAITWRLNEI